jgi:hypothetical protein
MARLLPAPTTSRIRHSSCAGPLAYLPAITGCRCARMAFAFVRQIAIAIAAAGLLRDLPGLPDPKELPERRDQQGLREPPERSGLPAAREQRGRPGQQVPEVLRVCTGSWAFKVHPDLPEPLGQPDPPAQRAPRERQGPPDQPAPRARAEPRDQPAPRARAEPRDQQEPLDQWVRRARPEPVG